MHLVVVSWWLRIPSSEQASLNRYASAPILTQFYEDDRQWVKGAECQKLRASDQCLRIWIGYYIQCI